MEGCLLFHAAMRGLEPLLQSLHSNFSSVSLHEGDVGSGDEVRGLPRCLGDQVVVPVLQRVKMTADRSGEPCQLSQPSRRSTGVRAHGTRELQACYALHPKLQGATRPCRNLQGGAAYVG